MDGAGAVGEAEVVDDETDVVDESDVVDETESLFLFNVRMRLRSGRSVALFFKRRLKDLIGDCFAHQAQYGWFDGQIPAIRLFLVIGLSHKAHSLQVAHRYN